MENVVLSNVKTVVLPGGKLPRRHHPADAGADIYTAAIVRPEFYNSLNPCIRVRVWDWSRTDNLPRTDDVTDDWTYRRRHLRDLHTTEKAEWVVRPNEIIAIGTGLIFDIPEGWAGYLEPRSSTAQDGIVVLNASVPIDAGFHAEPYGFLKNISSKDYPIRKWQRIVQVVFKPVGLPDFSEVDLGDLKQTPRGNGCLASTGR